MADLPTSGSNGGDDALSSRVFIAVISSVGSVILIIAIMMICAFTCLCYNEYRKRRSQMQKNSDRVGLLRSRAEDEDIGSDQETEVGAMSGIKPKPHDKAAVAALPGKSPPLLASNRVCPEPTPPSSSTRRQEGGKSHNGHQGGEEEEEVVCTMIDDDSEAEGESQATAGDQDTYELNAELDDKGDEGRLIQSTEKRSAPENERRLMQSTEKRSAPENERRLIQSTEKRSAPENERRLIQSKEKNSAPETKAMDLDAKAALLGRSVSYVEQLSKSCPLDAKALAALSVSKTVAQYKSVPTNSVDLPDQSAAERAKNRYRNVLPNPHSAVNLKYTGTEGSTYINGNFIRGLHGEETGYIATQGPTFDTMPDFWRLVWEKDVSLIVMLTNMIENGRHKCVKYWPPANEKNMIVYGDIEVTRMEEEQVDSCYTLSRLSVRNTQTGEKRAVYHYWCIAWPDFGIPKVAEPILKLRKAVDKQRTSSSHPGPVLVHCSAGLGRSGTFIAIDMGIQQYQTEGIADPLKYLCSMRQDRGGMIQTQDQYTFVHQALVEYIH